MEKAEERLNKILEKWQATGNKESFGKLDVVNKLKKPTFHRNSVLGFILALVAAGVYYKYDAVLNNEVIYFDYNFNFIATISDFSVFTRSLGQPFDSRKLVTYVNMLLP